MFLGHYAAAYAAKRAAPRASLGVLFASAQLVDLVWPIFLLAGIEHARIAPGDTAVTPLAFEHYPWTHSLLMVLVWALGAALIYAAVRRYRAGAIAVGALVVSHWVLDLITHRPDLPLYPGGDIRVGLGLWNFPTATFVLELGIFAVGVWLYAAGTRARDRIGRIGMWTLVGFLLVIHAANFSSPPPPSMDAVAWVGLVAWLLPVLAWWIDRHREPAAAA